MREYDAALKLLLQTLASSVLRRVTGGMQVTRWLKIEFSQVQTRRVDLLGVTATGDLIHIEMQSSNDSRKAHRMEEYALAIYRQF